MANIKNEDKFVSKEDFNKFAEQMLELMKGKSEVVLSTKEATEKKEIESAGANKEYLEPVPPAWVADAKEKLGEMLDHCEMDYTGGINRYHVIIKKEFSNDTKEHLNYYKLDRRTKAIYNGLPDVLAWNTLIARNLKANPPIKQ